MKRITFYLPDETIAMAFTVVMKNESTIGVFTECHGVGDGTVFTLESDGTDNQPHYTLQESKGDAE
jgi:hypothetical protein